MQKKNQWYIIGGITTLIISIITILYIKAKRKNMIIDNDSQVDKNKNFIIGDSQSPLLAKNSKKSKLIKEEQGESSLWQSGKNLNWLKNAVNKYPVSNDVNTIIINIGTNGKFNVKDDIAGLVNKIKDKFPNAKLLVVKGSWGWGGNSNVTTSEVNRYYDIFEKYGVKVLDNAIGKTTNPHKNIPIYQKIGVEIDKNIT